MAVDERSRHELYVRLESMLGRAEADTLMSLLPPVGWADVATRQDLAQLEARLDMKIDALGDTLRAEWRQALLDLMRTMVVANVTTMVALVSLTYAAVRLG